MPLNFSLLAAELIAAGTLAATLPPIAERTPGFDLAAAYEVQACITRERLSIGWRIVGRKIGFTNRGIEVSGAAQAIANLEGRGGNALGHPLLALAHLADVLAEQTQMPALAAGAIISTGTLTDALPVAPGETWSTHFSGLDVQDLDIEFLA